MASIVFIYRTCPSLVFLIFLFVSVSPHPPTQGRNSSWKVENRRWHHHEERSSNDWKELDDALSGFGQRLSVTRRHGVTLDAIHVNRSQTKEDLARNSATSVDNLTPTSSPNNEEIKRRFDSEELVPNKVIRNRLHRHRLPTIGVVLSNDKNSTFHQPQGISNGTVNLTTILLPNVTEETNQSIPESFEEISVVIQEAINSTNSTNTRAVLADLQVEETKKNTSLTVHPNKDNLTRTLIPEISRAQPLLLRLRTRIPFNGTQNSSSIQNETILTSSTSTSTTTTSTTVTTTSPTTSTTVSTTINTSTTSTESTSKPAWRTRFENRWQNVDRQSLANESSKISASPITVQSITVVSDKVSTTPILPTTITQISTFSETDDKDKMSLLANDLVSIPVKATFSNIPSNPIEISNPIAESGLAETELPITELPATIEPSIIDASHTGHSVLNYTVLHVNFTRISTTELTTTVAVLIASTNQNDSIWIKPTAVLDSNVSTLVEGVEDETVLETVIPSRTVFSVYLTPSLSRNTVVPVSKVLEDSTSRFVLLDNREEENVVNDVASVSETSRPLIYTDIIRNITSTTIPTSTTFPPKKSPSSATHSLEDILQRLVPAKDDSNPFLTSPTTRINHVLAKVKKPNEEIRDKQNESSTTNAADTNSSTSIYIVGIVAIIPVAGVVLWLVRIQVRKRRERLTDSETSSETEFRKTRLQPVALSPSKHGRLFYGVSDKEDLVPSSSKHSPWEFSRSRLRLQTLIGEGNFGQVWKAEAEDICGCQGTLLVAVKTVKDGASNKEKQELLREMKIMQQLGPHPNVVALLGCCTDQEPFLLIMEYVMYGRLLTFLRDHRTHQTYYNYSTDAEAITSRDLTTFAYCVAKGMEYISAKGIVHRDLAARNVLVDHNKMCKVADFGLSRSIRDSAGEMYEQKVKGALPIRWMAPESLVHSIFTQKSDVWSFGILVWEIVTLGSTPYPGMEAREVMKRVKEGHRLERPSHCRHEFYRLMSHCWHSDPMRRPDFSDLKSELGRLLDDANGYIDLDNFQDSAYVPLQSPSDESEKV